jgi:hypothetical protein
MKFILLLALSVLVFGQLPNFDEYCIHNPDAYSINSSVVLKFFNGCWRVSDNSQVLINSALYIKNWLDPLNYVEFVFIMLFSLPFLYDVFNHSNVKEMISRYAFYILELSLLMFRISLAFGSSPWMLAVFRQSSPCLCQIGDDPFVNPSGVAWGMPASSVLSSTLLGLHLVERVNVFFGVSVLFLNPLALIGLGFNSIGQVWTGLTIGIVLHFYLTRTPLFLRLIEILVNVCCGIITLFIVGHFYPGVDFTFAHVWFKGIVWQIFSLIPIFTFFSFKFIKSLLLKRDYLISIEDIQFGNVGVVPEDAEGGDESILRKIYNSKVFISTLIISFLTIQILIEVLKRYMNNIFHL